MDKNEYIYKVTRRTNRVTNSGLPPGTMQTKLVTKRALSAILRNERDNYYHGNPTRSTLHIERAKIGDFENCTLEFMPELSERGLDSDGLEEQVP